jgi:hypothetical protein
MATLDQVLHEVRTCPEPILGRILDFIQMLKRGEIEGRRDHLIAAEAALIKDWNLPREGEAWRRL